MRYSFGLGESSLDHRRREEFPAILFAQHGQTLTGESPEHAQIVGSV